LRFTVDIHWDFIKEKKCEKINAIVQKLTEFECSMPIRKVLDPNTLSHTEGINKFNTKHVEAIMARKYTGREMDTVAQIAICLFYTILPAKMLHGLSIYLEYFFMLSKIIFSFLFY
jgi:hypothetical protein